MHFIDDAPPPSYDQIDAHPSLSSRNDQPVEHNRDSMVVPVGLTDLSEKVVEQHQVIQVQELEIGKLRRDLGRIREQVDRMEQQKVPMPAKLEQTLARVVGEEEEERRWHRRSRKGDIIGGLVCAAALLAVLGLGLYIVVFSKPPMLVSQKQQQTQQNDTTTSSSSTNAKALITTTMSTTSESPSTINEVRQFRIIGKGNDDSFCWASAQLNGVEARCNVFRQAVQDPQLFCTFARTPGARVYRTQGRRFAFPLTSRASRRTRNRPLIMLAEDPVSGGCADPCDKRGLYTHVLSAQESAQARATCTEQWPFRFGGRARIRNARRMPAPVYWALRNSRHRQQKRRHR